MSDLPVHLRRRGVVSLASLRGHARRTYMASQRPLVCAVCGHPHFEVAHVRAVADFGEDVLVGEVNDLSNLVALCPNHHRAYDAGQLSGDDAAAVREVADSDLLA